MAPTLVILAAGMASRYGSMKQTEGFGPAGETIMEYSIYDAIRAGFGKVVFIIRADFAAAFKQALEPKLKGKIEIAYVFQSLDKFTEGFNIPSDRVKPWGTAHALLCCKEEVKESFAVINADDYYGLNAFEKAYAFLHNQCNEKTYAIIGYQLDKTLSEHGTVSRGVCEIDSNHSLISINECTKIYKNEGVVVYEDDDKLKGLSPTAMVSMNFWCFHPSIFNLSKKLFEDFVSSNMQNIKAEFFIPIIADYFIKSGDNTISVIPTSAQWFGVTYKEDSAGVKEKINQLIQEKVYPTNLWQ